MFVEVLGGNRMCTIIIVISIKVENPGAFNGWSVMHGYWEFYGWEQYLIQNHYKGLPSFTINEASSPLGYAIYLPL